MPLRQLLADATDRLAAAGVASPRVDAELLLAARLGIPRSRLATRDDVPASVERGFTADLDRRVAREPLQHITGTAPFRTIEVAVGPGVFVPRPETELLVDAVLPHLRTVAEPRAVDLCSGSGALALALAVELDGLRVLAVERSHAALRWLGDNVARTPTGAGVVQVLAGDIADPELLAAVYGRADAVVCNPPYVPSSADVSPEVLADPREAVFAGPYGLDLMSTVVLRAAQLLAPGGIGAIEHDDSQGEAVAALLQADDRWASVEQRRDLSGRPRYVVGVRA